MSDTSFPAFLFHQGTNYHTYEYLGVSSDFIDNKYIYTFRVWAPNADRVGLVSDFIGWSDPLFMQKDETNGVFQITYTSKHSLERQPYKFRIFANGRVFDKGDPYARFSRGSSDGASLIFTERRFGWCDSKWLQNRKQTVVTVDGVYLPVPINIYEIHLGSFMRHADNRYYSYRDLAEMLPAYLKKLGYTHVEFLPLQEYPYDGSWGYQICGFYAPTSRFGNPDDFRYLIDRLHVNGIGVIMDWVPAHFPKDAWGLYEFDGSLLYEYSDPLKMEAPNWGTRFFDLAKPEVHSFLISNALYFLREFHIDGLRVDAVSSMLYLDSDRAPGMWRPNIFGGRENLEAIDFFKKLNTAIANEFPDVLTVAEESTAYGKITLPIADGGLGFSLKWNMGWANDFYDYVSTDPLYRGKKHKALNFPLMYAFTENYCMPISHDEVVHGKRSFVDKMFGDTEDKFRQARVALMLMMTYPGKKLLFMGTEFAQFREWDYDHELEWFMLEYENHSNFSDYVSSLNHFYLSTPELWEIDFDEKGFKWIYPDEADKNSVAFKRISKSGEEVIVVMNFSGMTQTLKIPASSDESSFKIIFGTGNVDINSKFEAAEDEDGIYADVVLPKYSGMILKDTKNIL